MKSIQTVEFETKPAAPQSTRESSSRKTIAILGGLVFALAGAGFAGQRLFNGDTHDALPSYSARVEAAAKKEVKLINRQLLSDAARSTGIQVPGILSGTLRETTADMAPASTLNPVLLEYAEQGNPDGAWVGKPFINKAGHVQLRAVELGANDSGEATFEPSKAGQEISGQAYLYLAQAAGQEQLSASSGIMNGSPVTMPVGTVPTK